MQTYNKLKNISETTADSKIAIIAFWIWLQVGWVEF